MHLRSATIPNQQHLGGKIPQTSQRFLVLPRKLDRELVLDRHHEHHQIERIHTQLGERRIETDL